MSVDPDILCSIPTRSSLELLDTRFWQVGSCIHGLLPRGGSKVGALVRFHVIKKKGGNIYYDENSCTMTLSHFSHGA